MDKKTQKPKVWVYKHPDGTPKVSEGFKMNIYIKLVFSFL